MKTLFKLFYTLFSMLMIAAVVSNVFNVPFIDAVSVMLSISVVLFVVRLAVYMKTPTDATAQRGLAYGVALEFWEATVAEYLFREYPWLMRAKDRSGFVLENSVVHIPQAGAAPGGTRNRSIYPVPVVKRSDSDLTYVIDQISTEATHIQNAEKIELSYDKVGSVLGDHIKQLNYLAAKNAMYRWANGFDTSDNMVGTTGAATASYLSGTSGNRNKLLVADVASAKTILNNQTKRDLNPGKRALILSENAYLQLKSDAAIDTIDERELVGAVVKDGDLVKIHGFDIIRTDVMPITNSSEVVYDPFDYTAASGDQEIALLVDFDYVHIAKSAIKVFETLADATWQGDLYSCLLRMGASRERTDQAGIVAIVQQ